MGSPYYVPGIGQDGMPIGMGQPVGLQNPNQGYVYIPDPQAPIKDTFQNSQQPYTKKERILTKFFNNKTWIGAMMNSGLNLATGGLNFFKSMVYSEEEGLFRAVKTAGALLVGGVAIAAGMAVAPMLTGAALAGLTVLGVGAAATKMVTHGLGWLGNMFQGKYDRAVEHAHDFGEGTTEGVLATLTARQATSSLMRQIGKTPTRQVIIGGKATKVDNEWWNIRQTWRDMKDTLFNRGFFRNAKNELADNIGQFKSDARLAAFGDNTDVVRAFNAIKHNRGRMKIQLQQQKDASGKPMFTKKGEPIMQEEWVDAAIPKNSSLTGNYNPSDIRFHKAIQQPDGNIRLFIEQRFQPIDANGLKIADRSANSVFHEIIVGKTKKAPTRLQRTIEYNDQGIPREVVRPVEFRDDLVTYGPTSGQRSDWRVVRAAENISTKVKAANEAFWDTVKLKGLRKRLFGTSADDIASEMAKNDGLQAFYGKDKADFLDLNVRSLGNDQAYFSQLKQFADAEIQPTLFDKSSGVLKALFTNLAGGKNAALTQYNLSNGGVDRVVSSQDQAMLLGHAEKMLGRTINPNHQILKMNTVNIPATGSTAPIAKQVTYAVIEDLGGGKSISHMIRFRVPHDLHNRLEVEGRLGAYLQNALLRHETTTGQLNAVHTAPQTWGQRWTSFWHDLGGRSERNRPVVDILTTDSKILAAGRGSVQQLQGNRLASVHKAHSTLSNAYNNNQLMWTGNSNVISTVGVPLVSIPAITKLSQTFSNTSEAQTEEDKKAAEEAKKASSSSPSFSSNTFANPIPAYGSYNNPFAQQENYLSGRALC